MIFSEEDKISNIENNICNSIDINDIVDNSIEDIKYIDDKIRKYNILKMCGFLLSIGLTMLGTISIMSLAMFIYERLKISLLKLIVFNGILACFYSIGSKKILNLVDNKEKKLLMEIEDFNKKEEKKRIIISSLQERFNQLSRENQIKILNYIKDNCLLIEDNKTTKQQLESNKMLLVIEKIDEIQMLEEDKGYSRKRIINH